MEPLLRDAGDSCDMRRRELRLALLGPRCVTARQTYRHALALEPRGWRRPRGRSLVSRRLAGARRRRRAVGKRPGQQAPAERGRSRTFRRAAARRTRSTPQRCLDDQRGMIASAGIAQVACNLLERTPAAVHSSDARTARHRGIDNEKTGERSGRHDYGECSNAGRSRSCGSGSPAYAAVIGVAAPPHVIVGGQKSTPLGRGILGAETRHTSIRRARRGVRALPARLPRGVQGHRRGVSRPRARLASRDPRRHGPALDWLAARPDNAHLYIRVLGAGDEDTTIRKRS